MKVQELIKKLQQCNPDYDVVLAQVACVQDKNNESQEDWTIRVDNVLNQVFQDHSDKEVCVFTAVDNQGNSIQISSEVFGIEEII